MILLFNRRGELGNPEDSLLTQNVYVLDTGHKKHVHTPEQHVDVGIKPQKVDQVSEYQKYTGKQFTHCKVDEVELLCFLPWCRFVYVDEEVTTQGLEGDVECIDTDKYAPRVGVRTERILRNVPHHARTFNYEMKER